MKLKTLNLAMLMAMTASVLTLTGCAGEDGSDGVDGTSGTDGISSVETPASVNVGLKALDVAFDTVALPVDTATKTTVQASTKAMINGAEQAIGYTKLIATGEVDNGETYGAVKDYLGAEILFEDASAYICNGTNAGVGSGLDYFSILQEGGNLYMVSQFECQVGAMYINELEQDGAGALSVKAGTLNFIDQSSEFGGFVHCAGQTTPWQSHLGSEEYEPNARSVEEDADAETGLTGNKYYDEVAKFWAGDIAKASPYYYGWTPEVQVSGGTPSYMKHYSMGRFSHELAYVMPDQKTVYLSDDGTNVGLFMFVADTAGDLSAGSLYALKWNQVSGAGLGSASINWIDLGHTSNAAIRTVLDADNNIATNDAPIFSDIFSTEDPAEDGSCPTEGFTATNTTNGNECLKLNDINGDSVIDDADGVIASRLETRRYASMMGATTEFRKEEGITFNAVDGKLYVAMSEIARGMEDNMKNGEAETKYDIGGNNDIKLDYNYCGGVYELDVAADSTIGSDFVAYNMKGLIAGIPTDYSANEMLSANACDVNGISNPDNVTFLEDSNILVIGEDTSKHENNMIWAYNIKDRSLNRILSTPLDAETTAPFWHKDVNGFGYMTAVTQHPMEDQESATDAQKESEAGVLGVFDFSTTP